MTDIEEESTAPLELSDEEREILEEEIDAFAGSLRDPEARERYGQLDAAARQGVVPAALIGPLETMLELVLQTQRIRKQYGPQGESMLLRLFQRTPRGSALKQSVTDVNEALAVLQGQVLEEVSFSATPRGHTMLLYTDQCRLTLTIGRSGVYIERMETGA